MSCRMLTTIITTKRGENKQLSDPNSLFAASVSTRCARRDRPEAGRRPRYRKFESLSLQWRVKRTPYAGARRAPPPARLGRRPNTIIVAGIGLKEMKPGSGGNLH